MSHPPIAANAQVDSPAPIRYWGRTNVYGFLKQICALNISEHVKSPTHLIMSGFDKGKIYLPQSKHQEFLRCYQCDLECNAQHFLIEMRTPVFRFFCDFDIKTTRSWDDEIILSIMKKLQQVVKSCYDGSDFPPKQFDLFILKTYNTYVGSVPDKNQVHYLDGTGQPGDSPQKKANLYKIGIHPVFPHLYVDQQQALSIRQQIVRAMEDEYMDRLETYNTWEDIVDVSVYMDNGLRMPGSYKVSKCDQCKGSSTRKSKNPAQCYQCGGFGRVAVNRSYNPFAYIHGHGAKVQRNTRFSWSKVLALTSIRMFDVSLTPGFKSELLVDKPPPRKRIEQQGQTVTILEEDEKVLRTQDHRFPYQIPISDERFQVIRDFIHTLPKYKRVVIKSVRQNNTKDVYCVNVQGEGSRYCSNIQRDHNSNSIYFIITKKACIQRCFCRCNTTRGRINGMCKNYRSPPYELTPMMFIRLFPFVRDKKTTSYKQSLRKNNNVQLLESYIFILESECLDYNEQFQTQHDGGAKRSSLLPSLTAPTHGRKKKNASNKPPTKRRRCIAPQRE